MLEYVTRSFIQEHKLYDHYKYIDEYSAAGLILVRDYNDAYGYISAKTGKIVINCNYKYARRFNNGYANVTTFEDERKFINKGEETVVHKKSFTERKEMVSPNDNHVTEKFIQEHWLYNHYQYIDEYPSDGLILVRDFNGNYGYIDAQTGENTIECIYKHAKAFSEGLADVVTSQNEKIFIDKHGNKYSSEKEQEMALRTI